MYRLRTLIYWLILQAAVRTLRMRAIKANSAQLSQTVIVLSTQLDTFVIVLCVTEVEDFKCGLDKDLL